jgi:putative heme transporter
MNMNFNNRFNQPETQKNLLLTCMWVALAAFAYLLRDVLLPFVFAALLAYVLDPLVSKLCSIQIGRHSLPRWAAIVSVYIFVAGFVYIFATLFLPEIYQELLRMGKAATEMLNQFNETKINELAIYIDTFLHRYNLPIHIIAPLENLAGIKRAPALSELVPGQTTNLVSINLAEMIHNIVKELGEYIHVQSADIVDGLQNIIRQTINFIFKFFLVLMLAGFMLVDTARIKKFAFSLVLTRDKATFDALLNRIDIGLSGAIRGQLMICLINAILTLIGLWIFKVKFALVLATMAGVFSLIPLFGSIISTIPIALVALSSSAVTALMAISWIVAIHGLEANFLNPKVLGQATQIHPVIVVLALLTGEHFYGLAGALLAVPVTSILLNIFQAALLKAKGMNQSI